MAFPGLKITTLKFPNFSRFFMTVGTMCIWNRIFNAICFVKCQLEHSSNSLPAHPCCIQDLSSLPGRSCCHSGHRCNVQRTRHVAGRTCCIQSRSSVHRRLPGSGTQTGRQGRYGSAFAIVDLGWSCQSGTLSRWAFHLNSQCATIRKGLTKQHYTLLPGNFNILISGCS